MSHQKKTDQYFLILCLLVTSLIGYMAWPFINAIIFAGIFAGIFNPLMNRFVNSGIKRSWSALIICLIIVLSIFIPSIYFIIRLTEELSSFYIEVREVVTEDWLKEQLFGEGYFAQKLKLFLDTFQIETDLSELKNIIVQGASQTSVYLIETFNSVLSNSISFLLDVFIMLVIIYSLLLEGPVLKKFLFTISPIADEEEQILINKFNQINYITLVCNGVGGAIQGSLAAIGFLFAGIESIVLWGTLMALLAFIPLVGISFVYVPASIYLMIHGKMIAGISLFIYCTAVALIIENWFKPKFMGKQIKINSILVFLSIIGGLSVFGMPGIFYGPIIIIIFLTCVHFYSEKFEKDHVITHNHSETS